MKILKLSAILFPILLLFSCRQIILKVDKIPANTPKGAFIYVTGNFNYWNTSEQKFMLKPGQDKSLCIKLPLSYGKIEYKFTRGDWTSMEADLCGYAIENRKIQKSTNDTVHVVIESWSDLEALDCQTVTIVLDKLPENTPKKDIIAISGTFNNWQTSEKYILKQRKDGRHEITIPKISSIDNYEFKFTRGNLKTEEADKYGNEILNRKLEFGKKDTLYYSVENWKDIARLENNTITVIITSLPAPQLTEDEIFITGSFNYWYPADKRYKLFKNKWGFYETTIPRTDEIIEFKFTRGDWSMEEVDKNGNKIPNRRFKPGKSDTIFASVDNWIDRINTDKTSIFVIQSLPPNTPKEDKIFLACNQNGWNPGDKYWAFKKDHLGKFVLKHLFKNNSLVEFKITRGSWDKVEFSPMGTETGNRKIQTGSSDSIFITVDNWKDIKLFDQNKIVLLITDYPKNTPPTDLIYCAGTFNRWNPKDKNSICVKRPDGKYEFTIEQKNIRSVDFKFTRGGWEKEETDASFKPIPNRFASIGYIDTLQIQIVNWKDLKN